MAGVGRHNAQELRRSLRWLFRSREFTNFTYELTPLSREYLCWFVAAIARVPVCDVRGYVAELETDQDLRRHIRASIEASPLRGSADREVRYGRRAGWYALTRALQPAHIVETGTDKGLGACVFAAALLRNGSGRLTTIDVNPTSGYLVNGPYAAVCDLRVADSLAVLPELRGVDLFIHDSDHSPLHEAAELRLVEPLLSDGALVLSDNADITDELARWAEATGREFSFFAEQPSGHWFRGGGIGAAR